MAVTSPRKLFRNQQPESVPPEWHDDADHRRILARAVNDHINGNVAHTIKSPDGTHWYMTIDNNGVLIFEPQRQYNRAFSVGFSTGFQ